MLRTLLVLLACFTVLGCKDRKSETTAAATKLKVLHFGNGDEPQDLDPHTVQGTPEHKIFLSLFEGLLSRNPDGQEPLPGVAERWETSADNLVYTFHLRENARWSNGDPVTASDFVGSYKRMLTPELGAQYAYMLYMMAGAEDYHRGRLKDFSQVGVKAINERTLQITLRQPATFFLPALLHYAWHPVHLRTIEKHGGLTRRGTAWTRPENFVSNGPFILKEWRPHQRIVVERSPTYWDKERVALDQIHYHPVNSSETEDRMFRTGQLHVTATLPLNKLAVYKREMPHAVRADPWCGTYFYRFNVSRKPFQDVRVRRALMLAIDRESLVRNITLAGEQPAYHLVPPNVHGYNSRHRLKEDVAEARRLLAEAGYPNGQGFPRVELNFNTYEKHRTIAEAIQQMWRRNLGIDVSLDNQEWRVYMANQNASNFDIQRGGWLADYLDPHVFMDLWQTDGGNNHTRWSNPEYDKLLAQALDAASQEARYEIYQQMEKILIDEAPFIPLFFYVHTRLIDPRVNYRTTLLDDFPFKHVVLKD
jgi:oligopeptide transport system substrate-binding protein